MKNQDISRHEYISQLKYDIKQFRKSIISLLYISSLFIYTISTCLVSSTETKFYNKLHEAKSSLYTEIIIPKYYDYPNYNYTCLSRNITGTCPDNFYCNVLVPNVDNARHHKSFFCRHETLDMDVKECFKCHQQFMKLEHWVDHSGETTGITLPVFAICLTMAATLSLLKMCGIINLRHTEMLLCLCLQIIMCSIMSFVIYSIEYSLLLLIDQECFVLFVDDYVDAYGIFFFSCFFELLIPVAILKFFLFEPKFKKD